MSKPGERAMKFLRLNPEVPGDIADQSKIDASLHRPRVELFHLDSINGGGDDLVEVLLCYAVSPRRADAVRASPLTGFRAPPWTPWKAP